MKLFNTKVAIVLVVVLCLLELLGVGYLSIWRETFWQYVETKNLNGFYVYLGYFTVVALFLAVVTGFNTYLLQKLSLETRRKLTRKAFKVQGVSLTEGYAQRIQEDCKDYPWYRFQLAKSISMSVCYVIFYTWLIITQSSAVYLIIPVIYSLVGTYFGFKIAKPLIALNYVNQITEAAFRKGLTRVQYARAHKNNAQLYRKVKHLSYFQYFFSQISVIFPYILVASLYFSARITFGVLMQLASAIAHLVDSLSVLVNSFSDINKYLSCQRRLKELQII